MYNPCPLSPSSARRAADDVRAAPDRREFLRLSAGLVVSAGLGVSPRSVQAAVRSAGSPEPVPAEHHLVVDKRGVTFGDRSGVGYTIGDTIPGPLLRLKEGEDVVIHVTNNLDEDTSIHWHGLLVPADQDGVPDFSFDGIQPGETFTYRFRVRQAGTYWYHSHSGGQEQQGMYAPLIIDPAAEDPVEYDRDYTVVLSDWTDEDPREVLRNLKGNGGYYNYGRRTLPQFVGELFDDTGATFRDREMWGRMRMDPTDIADVTGATYTFLLNGRTAEENWTGLFRPGERVRLRFINAAAMTFFDVKIPGLTMTVVQADGQDVEPVDVDEFRIAVAETFDVIVRPEAGGVHTVFAQAMDRSGFVRGTLAEEVGLEAAVPQLDARPIRSMMDMPGMEMASHDMAGMDHEAMDMPASGGAQGAMPNMPGADAMDHGAMDHAAMGHGPMGGDSHRKLSYADLRALTPRTRTFGSRRRRSSCA